MWINGRVFTDCVSLEKWKNNKVVTVHSNKSSTSTESEAVGPQSEEVS